MKYLTLTAFALIALASVPSVASDEAKLEALMADYWAEELAASPLMATSLGAPGPRDQLDDVSPEARSAERARLSAYADRLSGINPRNLSEHGTEQFEVFGWMLENEAGNRDQNTNLLTFNTLNSWHSTLPQILLSQRYESVQDYEDLIKRYESIDTFGAQNVELLKLAMRGSYTQPCSTLSGYVDTITGYIASPQDSVFARPFNNMSASIPTQKRSELRTKALAAIRDVVNPAYQAFADFFAEEYMPVCRKQAGLWSLPGGREAYDQLLRYYTSLDTDADTVHELGIAEVARIQGEMKKVMAEVGFEGTLKEFIDHLANTPELFPSDIRSYLSYVAWVTRKIDGLLPLYFSRLQKNPYGIKEVPAQIAPKTTTAYYQPGAPNGTRAGNYFVNTYDLSSRPLYEIPALSLHEATPGHHLQISIQQETEQLPEWRRTYYFHAFGEGWGLYAEKLGEEMGMYTTPYEKFGQLIYEIWRAARLVVDPGIHAKGWTRQEAIDYMLQNTGLTEANIIAEVNRYITYPGQATAYKHGELKILELRARAEEKLGSDFDLREFHTMILEGGSMPLVVLEARIDRWIAKQLAR